MVESARGVEVRTIFINGDCENLTAAIPRTIEEIEAVLAK